MKTPALIITAAATLASAQVTVINGTFTCAKPNVAYCAGSSLDTDIIIRCDAASNGQPGRCGNNLAGQPPLGNNPSRCYQTSETAGDAACEKNCVVYASVPFTLPAPTCTPYYTATSSGSSAAPTRSATASASGSVKPTSMVHPTTTVTYVKPTGTSKPTMSPPVHNGTHTSKLPSSPTRTGPVVVPTAGAAVHQVGGLLAIAGLVAAYFI